MVMWQAILEEKCMSNNFRVADMQMVPYIAHEGALVRMERVNRRLLILCILLVLALVGTNTAWIIYENQFEDMTIEQEVETGQGNAYVSGMGDINVEGETNN